MVSGNSGGGGGGPTMVTGHNLSTVVPANVTGDVLQELTGVDLAMKLHYLRAAYYYAPSEGVEGLTVSQLKEPMFLMLDVYCPAAGRIRRHDSGRPHVKCNDSGVRIVEARCDGKTVAEWLEMPEVDRCKHLVYDKVLGPDLFFSPTVYLQLTRFKCGGMAVGVSWAHVLGDAVSASNAMNLWGHILATKQPVPKPHHHQLIAESKTTSPAVTGEYPLSIKKVDSVGDLWLAPTDPPMATVSFQMDETKLEHLRSKTSVHAPAFEAISAMAWRSVAKLREGKEPNLVTVIRNDASKERKHVLSNRQAISTASTDSSVTKLELSELAALIRNSERDEREAIDEVAERESGKGDYIVYGANLTLVDMTGVGLYGLTIKGQRPAYVDYSIHGVGEEGAILVLPGPEEGGDGSVLTAILPEDEIPKLREVLWSEWGIA